MNRPYLFAAMITVSLSFGCYTGNIQPKGLVETHMGESSKSIFEMQVANPDAGGTDPVLGMDGQTADGVLKNYKRNEKAEIQERKIKDQGLIKLRD